MSLDSFLRGGGELGARMRAMDWTKTPLGLPEHWPHGLKTAVRIMLTSRQPMWIGWGAELTYLYNDPYKSIVGGKHPKALGQPTSQVWSEIWSDIAPLLATAMRGEEGTYSEAQQLIMERNGYAEETYYTFSYSPIPDDDGATGGIFCANTDETERVVRERQTHVFAGLAAAAAQGRSMADAATLSARAFEANAHDMLFALVYLAHGQGAQLVLAAQTGMEADHPAAPPVVDSSAVSPWPFATVLQRQEMFVVDRPRLARPLPTGVWDRPSSRVVLIPLMPQGPRGVLVIGLNPYRLFDERYRSFVELVAAQVSFGLANARAYEEERGRADALAELDRAKTVFFSNVSHEFRTPLTLILGPLDDLRAPSQPANVREPAAVIHRNATRLLRLVNTLLDFSRIEAGRAQALYEPIDLAELTRDLASGFRTTIERAGVRYVVDCAPIERPVYVDRQMWEKIVLNLLSNAFKFTMSGAITVSCREEGDVVTLQVADTGTGIPPAEIPRLFERFHRIAGAHGRTHEGTGIGLAFVHELVKLHGGTIAVDSELGTGSVFTVRIPIGHAHLPPEQVRTLGGIASMGPTVGSYVDEALRWLPDDTRQPVAPLQGPGTAGLRARILVTDDNPDVRDYIARVLQPRWIVEHAGNGREALDAIRAARPDLLITDVMMPELDGFALVHELRADPQTRDLPIVMLSARAGEESTVDGLQAGADEYLVKPFSPRELVARVEAQLLRARIRSVEETEARRLSSVFAQAPFAVALLRGADHVFELANPLYLALVDNRPLIGKSVREAFPDEEARRLIAQLDDVYATGKPHIGRSLPLTLEGVPSRLAERFFDYVYQPLFDRDGRVESIAAVVYDVTELARSRRDAEQASRAKDEFLAMLGHELRNPLAPILTALQLMRLRGVDAAPREHAVIERQIGHLVTLVDDLLDVSRFTRGKIELTLVTIEVSEVVAKAIETSSPLLERNRHQLDVHVPVEGLLVNADPERLAQVVANLLTNAAKYTNPGGHIRVSARADAESIVLSVQDDGIGIAPDVLPNIFNLFVQAPQALDRAHGGLGLGLAIVQNLVEGHGGTVTASSRGRGEGSEFVIRLPRATPSQEADAPSIRPPTRRVSGNRARVLVVDDNDDAATMLIEALSACGFVTRAAHDGPSALRIAEDFDPDVALLDIGLPVMDGYELARRFGAHPRLRRARLVAATGYGQEQDRERSQAAGFAAHLVKPLDVDHVCAVVEQLTRSRTV